MSRAQRPRLVVVGGGAAGLELATQLGQRLGRRGLADVLLVDPHLAHIWKPMLHEVASGTLDSYADTVDYLAQARAHHFRFVYGRMDGLDRKARELIVGSAIRAGTTLAPPRRIAYDTLIITVGSISNDFQVPGVAEHCWFLDNRDQADRFHEHFLSRYLQAQWQPEALTDGQRTVAIVGGGATGVEFAAELHAAMRQLSRYGFDRGPTSRDLDLVIIQAGPRLVPELPPALGATVGRALERLGIRVHLNARVVAVDGGGLRTSDGHYFPAHIKIWAAGIKAPDFLKDLDGLETDAMNRLVVRPDLQVTRDPDIFAAGDCAACPQPGSAQPVPPRAQAAHQQAMLLAHSMERRLRGKNLPQYIYRDYGSLVSLGRHTAVGNLMGNLTGNITVSGRIARWMYLGLHKLHQRALHGTTAVVLATLADLLSRPTRPRLKLH